MTLIKELFQSFCPPKFHFSDTALCLIESIFQTYPEETKDPSTAKDFFNWLKMAAEVSSTMNSMVVCVDKIEVNEYGVVDTWKTFCTFAPNFSGRYNEKKMRELLDKVHSRFRPQRSCKRQKVYSS
jgi:hypothetical protein